VQVMGTVTAMQAAGHKSHGIGSIVPALAQNARAGHPQFRNGNVISERVGHPPRASCPLTTCRMASQGSWMLESWLVMSSGMFAMNGVASGAKLSTTATQVPFGLRTTCESYVILMPPLELNIEVQRRRCA